VVTDAPAPAHGRIQHHQAASQKDLGQREGGRLTGADTGTSTAAAAAAAAMVGEPD